MLHFLCHEGPIAESAFFLADGLWVRALYDYQATCDEELTFCEGQLIQVLRKEQNGIDDGFWEGILDGKIGVFPSLVVEEMLSPEAAAAQVCTKCKCQLDNSESQLSVSVSWLPH